jgi:hypothetical protein
MDSIFDSTPHNDNFHITQLVVSMTPIYDGHSMHMHANMPHDPKMHHI